MSLTMFFSSVLVLMFLFFHSSLAQSSGSANFQLQTSAASFSQRVSSSYFAVPPQSKIAGAGAYIIGGRADGTSSLLSDIYGSGDSGVNWALVGSFPVGVGNAIPALYVGSLDNSKEFVAVFGQSSTVITNDVWLSTSSLTSWSKTNAPYATRYDHSAAVLDYGGERYVFVMGGYYDNTRSYNDVWVSSAKNISNSANIWTRLADAPWSPRSGMAVASFHDNSRIVVAGGRLDSNFYKQVYVLNVNYQFQPEWTSITPTSIFPMRAYGAMFTLDEYLYFTSGINGDNTLFNDVYKSVDNGKTWTMLTANANFPARINPLVFVFNKEVVVAAGGGALTAAYNDVWLAALG